MDHQNDIQSLRRLLGEIADLCENASLTGSLSGGSNRVAKRYNAVLNQLIQTGNVPEGLFSTVPDDANYGEIGVEARMLAGYFEDQKRKDKRGDGENRNIIVRLAPFIGKEELGMLVRDDRLNGTQLDMHTLTSLAPFLGQDILSELVREHLNAKRDAPPSEASATKHESPAAPSAPTATNPPKRETSLATVEDDKKERAEDLLDILKSPYLSEEERLSLIERIKAIKS